MMPNSYEDSFEDNAGLDTMLTQSFSNLGSYLEAETTTAIAVSRCFSLPQPNGGEFQGWAFLDIGLANLTDTVSNTLKIQDCAGNTLQTEPNLSADGDGVDLNSIDADIHTEIRLHLTIQHTATLGGSILPAQLDYWNIYGRATGVTTVEVIPQSNTVKANSIASFKIQVKSTGAS